MSLGLSTPREESLALLSIDEGLTIEDLEFLILFDESEDVDNIEGELVLAEGMECG